MILLKIVSGMRRVSGIESITGTAHGDEVARLLRVELEALPELPDEVVDGAHRAGRLPPHEVEQLRAREHLVRMADEEHEELELEVRQLDLLAGALDHTLPEIDRDVAERELVAG